ncbi:MAG: cytochrome C [candidate division Zixibacteria bacterium]|nr:cytochrome C [candidate division Zixibacteria bacterium]
MDILRFTLIILLFGFSVSMAQLSPGDLTIYHESLEGITNCTSCHELGEGPSSDKCLECHVTLRQRIESKAGYHNKVVTADGGLCFDCHNEHAGKEFKLIVWPGGSIDHFNHDLTGYQLQGKHKNLACRDCHHPGNMSPLNKGRTDINNIRTFMGLSADCISCHFDEHRGQLQSDCNQCHSFEDWKIDKKYDHKKSKFQLTGKHNKVQCDKCHPVIIEATSLIPRDSTYLKYHGLSYGSCTSCHKDIHKGKFGNDCKRCHVTEGWKILDERNVDHSKTDYPLIGKHIAVTCDKCHKPNVRFAREDYDACSDCHTDAHWGQFSARPDGGRCESCHNESRFAPSLFSISRHNTETEFKLVDAHLAQPCIVCHEILKRKTGEEYRSFVSNARYCKDCHTDPHRGQFSLSDNPKECRQCHNTKKWAALLFDHKLNSTYPLEGAHKKVRCAECHKIESDASGQFVRYKPINTKCQDCHKESVANLKLLDG